MNEYCIVNEMGDVCENTYHVLDYAVQVAKDMAQAIDTTANVAVEHIDGGVEVILYKDDKDNYIGIFYVELI